MARPTRSRTPRRAPVVIAPQARPNLDVVAPLNVRTPGAETDPLQGLVQALGIAGNVMAGAKKERDEYDFNQGVADEQLGAADIERAEKSRAYARGAYQTAILEQYQTAQAKVAERAASELDHSLPIDQQVDIIDGWMKSELGPLVADDRAKVIFAERYASFINKAAAGIQQNQVEAHAKAAMDTWTSDLTNAAVDGTLTPARWDQVFHNMVSQTGDPVGARQTMVQALMSQMVNEAAEGRPYEHFRAMLPTEVTGPDGATLPGPMHSPAVQGIVNEAMAKAERLHAHAMQNQYAQHRFGAYTAIDAMTRDLLPVTPETFAANGWTIGDKPEDTFSPARAAAEIDRNARARAAAAVGQATLASYDAAYRAQGRLIDTLNVPGGPDSTEKLADYADAKYQQLLGSMGIPPEGMGGEALVSNPEAIGALIEFTSREGVPYRPLKNTMNSVNPASPGDVTARLDTYNAMKAANVTGDYLSDDAALIYEVANGAKLAGMGPEGIAERIRRLGDKDTSSYVAAKSKDVGNIFDKGFTLKTGNLLQDRNINSNNAANPAYLSGAYRSLVMTGLAAEMTPAEAQTFAKERIEATHTVLQLDTNLLGGGGQFFVLPASAVPNPAKATAALDWYMGRLPEFSKQRGIPEDEELEVRPVMGRGRRLTFAVFRAGGAVLVDDSEFTLPGLISTYDRMNPDASGQAQAARQQAIRQRAPEDRNRGAQFVPGQL